MYLELKAYLYQSNLILTQYSGYHSKQIASSSLLWFSQKFELQTLTQHSRFLSQIKIDRTCKRKSLKVQSVDLNFSYRFQPNESDIQSFNIMKRTIPIFDSTNKYMYCLIFKLTLIVKDKNLILKQLGKKFIGDSITE